MKYNIRTFFVLQSIALFYACNPSNDRTPFDPVTFKQVTISDKFWSTKIDTNRISGIPGCFAACNYSLVNFDIAAGRSTAQRDGTLASDSDVYKIIQGVAHALDHTRDPGLESFTDSLIERIAAAQEPDGYLDTWFTIFFPDKKWINEEQNHELYCAGHLFEAAADYYRVTGKRKLLDVAVRLADHIDRKFGKGKHEEVSGHEEIELALISLFEVTGEKRYLNLASFFLEERGNPERLKRKALPVKNDPNAKTPKRYRKPEYRQDHLPVRDQRVAVGHAVRAAYLYCGMADLARATGSRDYIPALESISNDIVSGKIYVTGATGTSEYKDEGFGSGSLKNSEAYCDTWYEPGCCPSNMVRFIPQIDQFIYGQNNNRIYINQFIGSEADIILPNGPIHLAQTTEYPLDGKVKLNLKLRKETRLALNIRIPAWTRGQFFPGGLYQYTEKADESLSTFIVKINDENKVAKIRIDGYIEIERKWSDGDRLELELDMPVRLVEGNPDIKDVTGKNVISRGPMVYCLEAVDNPKLFEEPAGYTMDKKSLQTYYQPDLLGGITTITGLATDASGKNSLPFTAIPYYAWCNRGPNAMRVWW